MSMSERIYIEDKIFEADAFQDSFSDNFQRGTYENCTFKNCNFIDKNFSESTFIDCEFHVCIFGNNGLQNTAFRGALFVECKLIGLNFDSVNDMLLKFTFRKCQMNMASFYTKTIAGTKFINCNLTEVDFAEADLSNVSFEDCDLNRAIFDNTNLSNADFTSAIHYEINPENNNVYKAKFSSSGLKGLLSNLNIIISD